jgi:DNA polymerase-3 subunit gamma/tau
MLKIIEEPPAKSIFIFCTTNPERIPKTILSRVQRYDFNRISTEGIVNRLKYILEQENYVLD